MSKRFQRVYVEIGNICNLQCSFCPIVARDKKVMEAALFEKVISEIAPLTEEVCFHLMGEPLLHHKFEEYVELCSRHALPVNITSNGVMLDEKKSDILLHPIIRQINFSLHSFTDNFPDGDLNGYLKKIFDFTKAAMEKRPDLYINFRLWNLDGVKNNEEILQRIENAFQIAINRNIEIGWRKNKKITGRVYLHFDTRFEWPSMSAPFRSTKGRCHGLSSHFGIHADGTVVPCCLDKEAGIKLGDCTNKKITEIIDGPRASKIAAGFKQGNLVEDLCQRCRFIERFDRSSKVETREILKNPTLVKTIRKSIEEIDEGKTLSYEEVFES